MRLIDKFCYIRIWKYNKLQNPAIITIIYLNSQKF